MKVFSNKQGLSDALTMVIIGGILGAIFIVGTLVWQKYDFGKRTDHFGVGRLVSFIAEEEEYEYTWRDYEVNWYQEPRFWRTDDEGNEEDIEVPFDVAKYHSKVTHLGVIFWQRGEIRQKEWEGLPNGTTYGYEYGIEPDFQLYMYDTGEFISLPELELSLGEQIFEGVYNIYPSTTENKFIVGIGIYDTESKALEPGMVGGQPDSMRSVVFDLDTMEYVEDDSLETHLEAIGRSTPMWEGMYWDSANDISVAVPGGEGCGNYSMLRVVDLFTGEMQNITGDHGGDPDKYKFTTINEWSCNPRNSNTFDGKWFVLQGRTKLGSAVHLYTYDSFPEPLMSKVILSPVDSFFMRVDWDVSNEYPILTLEYQKNYRGNKEGIKGVVVDFNDDIKEIETGWVTYRSDEYSYEFEHPEDWDLREEPSENIIISADVSGGTVSFWPSMSVFPISQETVDGLFEEWERQAEESEQKQAEIKLSYPERSEMLGEEVLIRTFSSSEEDSDVEVGGTIYAFVDRGLQIEIRSDDGEKTDEYLQMVADRFWQTFKFLEE